jgi:NADH dehydrogenase [ubiquinone] 1 alpha subcomplex assembly factor 6
VKGETTVPASGSTVPRLSPVGVLVRQHDRDRYRTALFAPSGRREALFALYAFNYEIARVRESVTTPMLGQIRLQWWREVLDLAYGGMPPRQHVVAAPLAAVIGEFALTRGHFDRLIDARERDLGDEAPVSLSALEDYAENTAATLLYLTLEVLGVRDAAAEDAAREIGTAYGLTGLLRALPFHARAGRRYIPDDVAADAGLDARDYGALRPSPALRRAVATVADTAGAHLRGAKAQRGRVPLAAMPAMLPAVIADRALRQLRSAGFDPFAAGLARPDPLQVWRLLLAVISRRF